jgi:hypothetical protein
MNVNGVRAPSRFSSAPTTPTGRFCVNQRLVPTDPYGPSVRARSGRLPNAVLRKVFRLAVAATPVVIKP